MSQSRARKPPKVGGEAVSKTRTSMVKASGDSAPCPPNQNQPKQHQNNKNKHNLPKSIRYDLESALVGLCDVWFEDIKPHLVRNKIKLHVDLTGGAASGDFGRIPPSTPGCSHLDPGAASDHLQQDSANSAASCSTPPTASKAQYRRLPPAQDRQPLPPPRRSSPPRLPDRNSKNKNSKSNSSRRNSPSQPPTSNWQVPQHQSYSPHSHQAYSHTRNIQNTITGIRTREEICVLSLVPRCRTKTRNKLTQTESLDTTDSIRNPSSLRRINKQTGSTNTNSAPPACDKLKIDLINFDNAPSNGVVDPGSRPDLDKKLSVEANRPKAFPISPSTVRQRNMDLISKISREGRKNETNADSVPVKSSQQQSPQNWKTRGLSPDKIPGSAPVSRLNREHKPYINSAPQKRTPIKRTGDPSFAPFPQGNEEMKPMASFPRNPGPVIQPNGHFGRCFATTNLNSSKDTAQGLRNSRKKVTESTLFNEEMVDIIASRNDKRIRVLYKSPSREMYPSVMNLAFSMGYRKTENNKSKKTHVWR